MGGQEGKSSRRNGREVTVWIWRKASRLHPTSNSTARVAAHIKKEGPGARRERGELGSRRCVGGVRPRGQYEE